MREGLTEREVNKMKYEMLWISSKDNQAYSNYAKNQRELKRKLDYFVNVKG